jgi:peptidoglycan/LPS O-acetylase OafA/YrhL
MENKIKNTGYFPALTGIRAIAAYMVFFHHFNPIPASAPTKWLHDFINEFHIGVTIFFTLSGFLIAYRYFDDKKINYKKYLTNRIARIYPMYFLLTTFTFVAGAIFLNQNQIHDFKIYLLNITFFRGFFVDFKFTGIAQGWSLTVEELFYLLAPISFILIKISKKFLLIIPFALLSIGMISVVIFQKINFYGFMGEMNFMLLYTFLGRSTEFFLGIFLALHYKQRPHIGFHGLYTYIGIFIIFLMIYILNSLKGDLSYGLHHPLGIVVNNILLPAFGICIFFWGLLTEKTLLSKILGSKLFEMLGKSSYIFYLIHMGLISIVIGKTVGNQLSLFILLNILSCLLYHYIEEPINKFLRKKMSTQIQ